MECWEKANERSGQKKACDRKIMAKQEEAMLVVRSVGFSLKSTGFSLSAPLRFIYSVPISFLGKPVVSYGLEQVLMLVFTFQKAK